MGKKLLAAFCLVILSLTSMFAQWTRTTAISNGSLLLNSDSTSIEDHSSAVSADLDSKVVAVKKPSRTVSPTAEENNNVKTHFYPNPSKGVIFFAINTEFNASDIFIEVSDLSGKIIRTSKIRAQDPRQVDLSELNEGLFFVKLTVGNKTSVRKIVVDRN